MATFSALIAAAAITVAAAGTGVVAAAADAPGSTIHIVIAGGPKAGTYDIERPEPCSVGFVSADDWFLSYVDPGADPAVVTIDASAGTQLDFFTIGFGPAGDDPQYTGVADAPTIDDQGATGSLHVAGDSTAQTVDGSTAAGGRVEVDVVCHTTLRPGGALPPAPSAPAGSPAPPAGSPPAGSSTFRIVVAGGPFAGTYETSTLADDACTADEEEGDQWAATFRDDAATPNNLSIYADRGDPDLDTLAISFGPEGDQAVYLNTDEDAELTTDDRTGTATLAVSWEHSQVVTSDGSLTAGGAVDVTVECAAVERVPKREPGVPEQD